MNTIFISSSSMHTAYCQGPHLFLEERCVGKWGRWAKVGETHMQAIVFTYSTILQSSSLGPGSQSPCKRPPNWRPSITPMLCATSLCKVL